MHTPLITGKRLRGGGRDVPRDNSGYGENVPKNEDGTVDYTKDFFGKETSLTVSGQLNGGDLRSGFPQHLYVRAYIPGGEF